MGKQWSLVWMGLALTATGLSAQTTNVTNSNNGVSGAVPVYSGAATLGAGSSSPITVSGSNVGIGTTSPNTTLTVNGVNGGIHLNMPWGINWANNTSLLINNASDTGDTGAQIWHGDPGAGGSHLLIFSRYPQTGNPLTGGYMVSNTVNGSVGIGTTAPGADLAGLPYAPVSGTPIFEVNGDIAMTQGNGGQMYFADGTVQATAWTGALGGGDYAESVEISGDRTRYEPGDLLVVDKYDPSKFVKSSEPYSTIVAGIYSTKPGTVGRRQTTPKSADEIPMAVVGIVPAKVSAQNGAIEAGDLLVSSSTPGVAMKGTDRNRMLGAIVGKAMGTLNSGAGVIEVLVTLQ